MKNSIKLILPIIILALALASSSPPFQDLHQSQKTHSSDISNINYNLSTKSLEELKQIAQRILDYLHKKKGRGGDILYGLYSYIDLTSKVNLINSCMKIIEENPELINIENFTSVIEGQGFIPKIQLGGLHLKWSLHTL